MINICYQLESLLIIYINYYCNLLKIDIIYYIIYIIYLNGNLY